MKGLLDFTYANWPTIAVAGATLSAIAIFVREILTIRHLRLQIQALKRESEIEKKSQIVIATLDEIERYSRKYPGSSRLAFHKTKISQIDLIVSYWIIAIQYLPIVFISLLFLFIVFWLFPKFSATYSLIPYFGGVALFFTTYFILSGLIDMFIYPRHIVPIKDSLNEVINQLKTNALGQLLRKQSHN